MKKVILGFFILFLFFGASNIYAQCDCAYAGESEADEAKRSEAAFIGEVTEINKGENVKDSEYNFFDITFKITKSLKEDSNKTITIRNIALGDSDFEIKESYLVFARIHNNHLQAWIGCCTNTKRIPNEKKANDKSNFHFNENSNKLLKCNKYETSHFHRLNKHIRIWN